MDASTFIARRLAPGRPAPGQQRSPAPAIATVGVALSVAVMLLTLAIVPGFKHSITRKVMDFDAQITLTPLQSTIDDPLAPQPHASLTPGVKSRLQQISPDATVSLTIRQPGILKTDEQYHAVIFHASDLPLDQSFLSQNIDAGALPDYTADTTRTHIVISRLMADALNLNPGDRVGAAFFTGDNLRIRRYTIAAIYNSHFNDFDRTTAFMSLREAQSLTSLPGGQGTALEIRDIPDKDLPEAIHQARIAASEMFHDNSAGCYYHTSDVFSSNPIYFNWLDLLDTNVIVILLIMGAVTAVTLISCLFIMILERIRMIGILKSLGATNPLILRIFLTLALKVVIRGLVAGNILAFTLLFIQWQWHTMPLDPEAYYLNYVPVEWDWSSFIILDIAVIALSLITMLLPARIITGISPARVMRFE